MTEKIKEKLPIKIDTSSVTKVIKNIKKNNFNKKNVKDIESVTEQPSFKHTGSTGKTKVINKVESKNDNDDNGHKKKSDVPEIQAPDKTGTISKTDNIGELNEYNTPAYESPWAEEAPISVINQQNFSGLQHIYKAEHYKEKFFQRHPFFLFLFVMFEVLLASFAIIGLYALVTNGWNLFGEQFVALQQIIIAK